jgi:hypothetical protein
MSRAQSADDASTSDRLRVAALALESARCSGSPLRIALALSHVAQCLQAHGADAAAEDYLNQALRWGRGTGSTDLVVDLLCNACETAVTIAESRSCDIARSRRSAARERAREHAFEASRLAAHVADRGWEATVLLRISDALDRCGDRNDAAALQMRALRLMSGSSSARSPDASLLPGLGRLADC